METEEIKSLIESTIQECTVEIIEGNLIPTLTVSAEKIEQVAQLLYTHKDLYYDLLSNITAVDNGIEEGTLEVIYNLYSIPFNKQLMVKVVLSRNENNEQLPEIPSVSSVWKAANWHEREAFDLMGIQFTNHPDHRRILLPTDWVGYPLRKDYTDQEKYHGVKVKY